MTQNRSDAMETQREVTWSWLNWTFGLWWHRGRRWHAFGIDCGPLEILWRWPSPRARRAHDKHTNARRRNDRD